MGEIIGGMIALYAIGKLLEWAFLKRFMTSFPAMVFTSSGLVFTGIVLLWATNTDKAYAFHPAMLASYFIAALILPVVRGFFYKRRVAKSVAAPASA